MNSVRINGLPADTVSALDRGLGYGDGLFETIRFLGLEAPLWSRHMRRLDEGCQRLRLPAPSPEWLLAEARSLLGERAESVVRITVTRGEGRRGYAPPPQPAPTVIVAAFEAPEADPSAYRSGVRVRLCELRLAAQPRLAGIKHLNRLEQVLARAEWQDPAVAEGLLLDAEGHVVCATMANVFAVVDGQLLTPALDRCGVTGVARAEVLAVREDTRVAELSLSTLLAASEVFLTSSVRGIVPVQSLGDKVFAPGPVTRALQRHWRDLGFAWEQA